MGGSLWRRQYGYVKDVSHVCLLEPGTVCPCQVSTESHVLVFDLLTLGLDPVLSSEFDSCLSLAFHNKVGVLRVRKGIGTVAFPRPSGHS